MDKNKHWLCFDGKFMWLLNRIEEWPLGYWRFILRGNRGCLKIFTHLTTREKSLLFTLALELPQSNCIVELGSYLGASSCFLAAAALENSGRLFCVDTWQNDGMSEGPRDTYQQFLSNTLRFKEVIVPIRKRSEEAALNFHPDAIDLLFVDSDHNYEAVVRDLYAWLPKTRPGAWLLMHDSGWAEGVKRAIQEIVLPLQVNKPKVLPNLYAVRVDWHKR